MTEAQWLSQIYPTLMMQFLKGTVSDRKLRLFACGCCRWMWDRLPDERSRHAVETAERFADEQASAEELAASYGPARRVSIEWTRQHPEESCPYFMISPADAAAKSAFDAAFMTAVDAGWRRANANEDQELQDNSVLSTVVRDIFGNPFQPTPLVPEWCSPAVLKIAQEIYAERAFSRMTELAEALVNVGCDDADILNHCSLDGFHFRGCWVIDLLLGKW